MTDPTRDPEPEASPDPARGSASVQPSDPLAETAALGASDRVPDAAATPAPDDAAPVEAALPEERQPGSRYVPAVLSALLPGLGQLWLHQGRRAIAFSLPVALLAGGAIGATVALGPARAATSLLSVEALWGVLALQVVLLGWRLAASGAALLDGRFGPLRRRDLVLLAVLAVAIVAPQAWALHDHERPPPGGGRDLRGRRPRSGRLGPADSDARRRSLRRDRAATLADSACGTGQRAPRRR